ncbi:MAG: ATP-binding protein [Candidatus Omnitrophica bacterium]|nr:ATP-binding protein [Candidatus Omnitrophota bacterium]
MRTFKITHRYLYNVISGFVSCLLLVNDVSFALSSCDKAALAPPLALKPPCEITWTKNADGKYTYDVVSYDDADRDWREHGNPAGRAFKNRFALADIGCLMGQMLKLTAAHKIVDPLTILKPLIKKHLARKNGMAEILLEGLDIDGIKPVFENNTITKFMMPVIRDGAPKWKLFFERRKDAAGAVSADETNITMAVEPWSDPVKETIENLHSMKHDIQNVTQGLEWAVVFFQENKCFTEDLKGLYGFLDEIKEFLGSISLLDAHPELLQESFMPMMKEIVQKAHDYYTYGRLKNIFEDAYSRVGVAYKNPDNEKLYVDILTSTFLYINDVLSDCTPDFRDTPKTVEVNAQIRAVVLLSGHIEKVCKFDYSAGNIEIVTDGTALRRALANIMLNASHAIVSHDNRGELNVRAQRTADGKHVEIVLSDTAGGISPELLPHIFDNGVSTKPGSNGQGLAIAKEYIENRCGGTITVASELGKGTTFTVCLPVTGPAGFGRSLPSEITVDKAKTLTRLRAMVAKEALSDEDIGFADRLRVFFLPKQESMKAAGVSLAQWQGTMNKTVRSLIVLIEHLDPARFSRDMDGQMISRYAEIAAKFDNAYFVHRMNHALHPYAALRRVNGVLDKSDPAVAGSADTGRALFENMQALLGMLENYEYYKDPYLARYIVELTLELLSTINAFNETAFRVLEDAGKAHEGLLQRFDLNMRDIRHKITDIDETYREIAMWVSDGLGDSGKMVDIQDIQSRLLGQIFQAQQGGKEIAHEVIYDDRDWTLSFIPLSDIDLIYLIENLVGNSVAAFEGISEPRISMAVSGGSRGNKTFVTIRYEDNGNGMAEDVLAKIRAGEAVTTKGEFGSGRGTRIIFDIIRRAGGTVDVQSGPGQGTVFVFDLPLHIPLHSQIFNLFFEIQMYLEDSLGNFLQRIVSAMPGYATEQPKIKEIIERICAERDAFSMMALKAAIDAGDNDRIRQYAEDAVANRKTVLALFTRLADELDTMSNGKTENMGNKVRVFTAAQVEKFYEDLRKLAECVSPPVDRGIADTLTDTLNYVQKEPLIIALGTSWIQAYERRTDDLKKFEYLQGPELNKLITALKKRFGPGQPVSFVVGEDAALPGLIGDEKEKDGRQNAKVVVMAGKNAVSSREFAGLRNDIENVFLAGIDNHRLTTDSYIRLLEMLDIALKIKFCGLNDFKNDHMKIIPVARNMVVFVPQAEPMDFERLKAVYEVERAA